MLANKPASASSGVGEAHPASTGQIGASPAPDGQAMVYTITSQGQLSSPDQFVNIVVKTGDNGAIVRVRHAFRWSIRGRRTVSCTRPLAQEHIPSSLA